jgi:hypothetical protein
MHSKRGRRQRRSEAQWAEILRGFASSGQGPHEFCRRAGLSLSSFQRWRQRLGPVAAEFVELVPTVQPAASLAAGWSFEVALPNGVQLRFRG